MHLSLDKVKAGSRSMYDQVSSGGGEAGVSTGRSLKYARLSSRTSSSYALRPMVTSTPDDMNSMILSKASLLRSMKYAPESSRIK